MSFPLTKTLGALALTGLGLTACDVAYPVAVIGDNVLYGEDLAV